MDSSELREWAIKSAEACKSDAQSNPEPQGPEPKPEQEPNNLPPFGALDFDNLPQLAPQLVTGILRQGHTLTLTAPSKAGKTWALLDFAVSLACGMPWMGFPCERCRVLYVDFELDSASFAHRVERVVSAKGANRKCVESNFVPWNLRGYSAPMKDLCPELLQRLAGGGFGTIVLDPVYLLLDGDENSAGDVREFVRYVSQLASRLGCSVAYSHHHSKGVSNYARGVDRGAGSGVFGRYADALLDFMPLDAEGNATFSLDHAEELARGATFWQVETTLREFPAQTFAVRYEFPLFCRADYAEGLCTVTATQRGGKAGGDAARRKREESNAALARALEALSDSYPEGIPIAAAVKADGRSAKTVKAAVDTLDGWERRTIGGNECRIFRTKQASARPDTATDEGGGTSDAAPEQASLDLPEGLEKA